MSTIYVTRRALTEGIVIIQVEDLPPSLDDWVSIRSPSGYVYHLRKPDWYATFEEAVIRAKKMRDRRIASLRKQLGKLEAMTFEDKELP